MGTTKTCDIHPTEDNSFDVEEMKQVVVFQFDTTRKRQMQNKLDVCSKCLSTQLVDRVLGRGIKYQDNWKIEMWSKGKTGKSYQTLVSPDEYDHAQEKDELQQLKDKFLGGK